MIINKVHHARGLAKCNWREVQALQIDNFRPEGSDHKPNTRIKLAHDGESLNGHFSVSDNYFQCQQTQFQSMVCNDACVELFLQPHANVKGRYLSLEISANGTILSYLIDDPERTETAFKSYRPLTVDEAGQMTITTSVSGVVEESDQPLNWYASFSIPFSLLKALFGDQYNPQKGIRLNAFKCADASSHPHWASLHPVPDLNFHEPQAFGEYQILLESD